MLVTVTRPLSEVANLRGAPRRIFSTDSFTLPKQICDPSENTHADGNKKLCFALVECWIDILGIFVLFAEDQCKGTDKTFKLCGSKCPRTCENLNPTCPRDQCVEGCFCNDKQALSNGQCTPLSRCGCTDGSGKRLKVSVLHFI